MNPKQKAESLVSKFFDYTTGDKFENAIICSIICCDECMCNRIHSGRAAVVKTENNKNQYWKSVKKELLSMQNEKQTTNEFTG